MITALLVMVLMSAMLVGFTAVIMSDQRFRFIDKDRAQAFYAASGGIEKLTTDLGNVFFANIAPTGAQIAAITNTPPSIPGVTYTASSAPTPLPASDLSSYYCGPAPKTTSIKGANGYTIMYCTDASGNPVTTATSPIRSGPYEGLIALQTPYQIDVTARTAAGGEAHLIRTMNAVAIPVFQFGIFSDVDLAFFAGPNFDFGGRVHTNGNLFLSQGTGATLTLRDKVTAVKEVIRQRLENGVSIDTPAAHTGNVNMATSPTSFRLLGRTEGSVVDGVGSALNDPTWQNLSIGTYNLYIRNGRTGAKPLNLPLITVGGTNPDLVRRPPPNEDVANPVLYNERLYTKASLRILLSDTAADILGLPGVTSTPPVQLDGDWWTNPPNNGTAYGPVDATHPPVARSLGPIPTTTTTAATAAGAPTISVNAVPALFQKPQITVKNGAGTVVVGPFTCATWTETQFQGCNVPSNLTSGWTIYISNPPGTATAGTVDAAGRGFPGAHVPPTATLNGNVTAGANRTLNLSAGQTTTVFAPHTFFITDVNGTANGAQATFPVTCTGATATQFTGCVGVPATAAGAVISTGYLQNRAATGSGSGGTIGGVIKIEKQTSPGVWVDVTMSILNRGFGGPNLAGFACSDPTPNAIIRIQRLRDNGGGGLTKCPIGDLTDSYQWWPNVLFDTREGLLRDVDPGDKLLALGGVIHYIAIDTVNLAKWFRGTAPYNVGVNGTDAITDNGGYTVYFSDRRQNRTQANAETAEYGFEDVVNPSAANGAPNGVLDAGEDVNGNNTLDVYGQFPSYNGVSGSVPPGATAPLDASARPTTRINRGQAQVNRALLFRHALKLINGANIVGQGVTGLTVVSENPVYIQGDWNATGGSFSGAHAATAVIADAVTLLSNAWNDTVSFTEPYNPTNRPRSANSWYRVAVIAGKGMAFPWPNGTASDFGTDGGTHNFLRYLEGNGGTLNYRGSLATFFYNRQAVGTYKCCTTVYSPPTRAYAFDVDFLNPALLPPNTPVFRDMNAVGFSTELRPGR